MVMIPFLFSVSGILVIQSHCSCTGKNQVSLYLPPDACTDILEDHNHLFAFHADDLSSCCGEQSQTREQECHHEDSCSDCGCDSPEAQFYQVDHKFTDEKVSFHKIHINKELHGFVLSDDRIENDGWKAVTSSWFNDPPPLVSSTDYYIYIICQIKIPPTA